MRLPPSLLVAITLLITPAPAAHGCDDDDDDDARDLAIVAIVAAGGRVLSDPRAPGEPIRSVTLVEADDALMEHASRLTQMTELSVHGRRVSPAGWEKLRRLANLENLILMFGPPIGDRDLENLGGLTRLRSLHLEYQRSITGAGLAGLKALSYLALDNSSVTDDGLASLAGLANLESIGLGSTRVTDATLAHLSGLRRLKHLSVADTRITDAGMAHLGGLTALESLNLSRTRITDAGLVPLEGLTSLRSLGLSGTRITDAGLEHLKPLRRLAGIDLSKTGVTDAGVAMLKSALPKLSVVR